MTKKAISTSPALTAVDVDIDAPLRLSVAAKLAFPGNGLTKSGLRREAGRGRLAVQMVAGKQFTTLRSIADMLALCGVETKQPVRPAKDRPAQRPTSGTADTDAALALCKHKLEQHRRGTMANRRMRE